MHGNGEHRTEVHYVRVTELRYQFICCFHHLS